MKITLLVALLLLFAGCNSSSENKTEENKTKDSNRAATEEIAVAIMQPVKLTKEQLPASLKFKGNFQEAWQWNDRLGNNILLTSIVEPFSSNKENEDEHSSELYAFHFLMKGENYQLLWKISDAEKACPFDLSLSFFKESLVITDLDNDAIAETTVQYKKACRSDVSPSYMKLIMHEDTTKYSLRGAMWIFDGGNGKFEVTEKDVNLEKLAKPKGESERMYQLYGRYETEKEFADAPKEFLQHARSQWLKYAKESFD